MDGSGLADNRSSDALTASLQSCGADLEFNVRGRVMEQDATF